MCDNYQSVKKDPSVGTIAVKHFSETHVYYTFLEKWDISSSVGLDSLTCAGNTTEYKRLHGDANRPVLPSGLWQLSSNLEPSSYSDHT